MNICYKAILVQEQKVPTPSMVGSLGIWDPSILESWLEVLSSSLNFLVENALLPSGPT